MIESVRPAPEARATPLKRRREALVRISIIAGSALVLVLGAAAGLVLWLWGSGDSGSAELGVPVKASIEDLHRFARSADRLVYWAGPPGSQTLELTQLRDGSVYVRYLSAGVRIGDRRSRFMTVATYPRRGAYAAAVAAAGRPGNARATAPGGGIAVWNIRRPTSVYVARPGTGVLVEVYDPSPARARALVLSGDVGPVR